jgi:transposase InsO family protein
VFFKMRCPKGGDVHAFLMNLKTKCNELTAVGVAIADKDYQRTVLRGIPNKLTQFALQLLTSAHLAHNSSTVDVKELIQAICEEADHLKIRCVHHQNQGKDGKKGQTDEALAATHSDNAGRRRRRKGKCHNCGKPRHWARECRSPKKVENSSGQSRQASSGAAKPKNKPVGSANIIVANDIKGDGFWMVIEEIDHVQADHTEPDPFMGTSEQQEEEDAHAEFESVEDIFACDESDSWMDKEGEDTADEGETAGAVITPMEEDLSPCTKLYDSGATRHITPYKADFTSYKALSPPAYLNTANQQRFPAIGEGNLVIQVPNNGTERTLTLHNALHAPAVTYTLVSIGALDEEGYAAHIKDGRLEIVSPRREQVGLIPCTPRRLYKVVHASDSVDAAELITAMELHRHLGHISVDTAHKLVESGTVRGIELNLNSQESPCDACIFARATHLPILRPRIRVPAKHFRDKVHTDIWGLSFIPMWQGHQYFASFTDDCTRFTVIFLIRTKDEAFAAYKTFEAWVLTQQHCRGIKVLRSDRSSEYLSKAFDAHLAAAGTVRCLTPHDTPQVNGIAERLNRMLLERVRTLTHTSGLPKSLWGEALRHTAWLKNQMATQALDGKTPYEAVYGQSPDLSDLRRWGCATWVHNADGSKLDVHMHKARWLSFDIDTRAHRVYWPDSRTVSIECNVYFRSAAQLEGEQITIPVAHSEQPAAPPAPSTSAPSAPPEAPPSPAQVQESTPDKPPVQLRRSARLRMPSRLMHDLQSGEGVMHASSTASSHLCGLQVRDAHQEDAEEAGGVWTVEDGVPALLEDFDGLEHVLMAEVADAKAMEPCTLVEAKRRPDWPLWEKAIEEELATLKAAGTWRLEEALPRANIIGSKWVFKAKKDVAGNIMRYKVRLVAQGFSQIGGIDYDNTYAPVTRVTFLRAIIAMANHLCLDLHQVDIKGAYLNGILNNNEVLYMQHPPGYKASDAGARVLCIIKMLYSLKQSGRRWYQKLTSIFTSLGFKRCSVDEAIFFKVDMCKGELTITAVHVDDCTIAATSICLIEELKASLCQHVEVTDLGELHWMLSIEIKRDCEASTIHLSQHAYIDAILHRYNFANLKPLATLMDVQVRLSSEQAPVSMAECTIMRDMPYHKAVGALNWAALSTL